MQEGPFYEDLIKFAWQILFTNGILPTGEKKTMTKGAGREVSRFAKLPGRLWIPSPSIRRRHVQTPSPGGFSAGGEGSGEQAMSASRQPKKERARSILLGSGL